MKRYVILGAGGLAREVFWHIRQTDGKVEDFVFVDDVTERKEIVVGSRYRFPVVKDWNFAKYDSIVGFVVGLGDPVGKKSMVEKALNAGLEPAPTIIHPRALTQGDDCQIGVGGVIAPGCVITTNVQIGNYVILYMNCTVGHDAVIGDYVSCYPGCQISGSTHLGEGVALGTGTVVRQRIRIARYVVTGAQACVVGHIEKEGSVVVGVPAKELVRQ